MKNWVVVEKHIHSKAKNDIKPEDLCFLFMSQWQICQQQSDEEMDKNVAGARVDQCFNLLAKYLSNPRFF